MRTGGDKVMAADGQWDVRSEWAHQPGETGRMALFVAWPDGPAPFPGLVYYHALPGLTDGQRAAVARLASHGFVVAAPDLNHRLGSRTEFKFPDEIEQAAEAEARQSHYGLAADGRVALNYLKENERVVSDRLGVIGYCTGGGAAWLTAAFHHDVRAAALVYGTGLTTSPGTLERPTSPLALAEWIECPVLSLSAEGDRYVPPSEVATVASRMAELGKEFECHIFDDETAGHAFFAEDEPQFFHRGAAEWGWPLKVAFLNKHLRSGT